MIFHISKKDIIVILIVLMLLILFAATRARGDEINPSAVAAGKDSLLFEQSLAWFRLAPVGSRERKEILIKIPALNVSFEQVLSAHDDPRNSVELNAALFGMLWARTTTHAHWHALWPRASGDRGEMKKIANGLIDTAPNFDECLADYPMAVPIIGEHKAVKRLETFESTVYQWITAYCKPSAGPELESKSLSQLKKVEMNFLWWSIVFEMASEKSELRDLSLKKMHKKAATHGDFLFLSRRLNEDHLDNLFKTATTFGEWLENLDLSPPHSKYEKKAQDVLLQRAQTEKELNELLKRAAPGSEFEKEIKARLHEFEKIDSPPYEDLHDPYAKNNTTYFVL